MTDLVKIEVKRKRGWQRMRWLDSITDSVDMNLSELWEIAKDREVWHATVHGVAKSWTGLKNNNKSGSSILRNIQNKRKLVLINDTFALTLKALHLHTCNHILICHFKKYFS